MANVTRKTSLVELKARVRAAEARHEDQSARLVRSIRQSLLVEGYDVREQVLLDALQRIQGTPSR